MSRSMSAVVIALLLFSGLQAQDRSVVLSYMTDTAPTIDGEIDGTEWDAAGPWINVTDNSPNAILETGNIAEDPWGGVEDLSYRFKTMWVEDTANFYLLYEVFDDIAMQDDPTNLWERDQIETFIDGTNLEGDDEPTSFHWFAGAEETYGKFGVSRYNTFEGNNLKMTDDPAIWDDGFAGNIISLSAASELETNADYRVELAISLIPMIDDSNLIPFFDTPTEQAGHIVADSTQIKFTVAVSDDDNFAGGGTERSEALVYYREKDGEPQPWDVSTAFADLLFTGQFEPVLPVFGDCNGDGDVNAGDLACVSTIEMRDAVLATIPSLPGDLDGDGNVAFPDFLTLSSNFGDDGGYSDGNIDLVGSIAFPDFLTLSSNFGKTPAAGGTAAAVPEPSSTVLLLLGLLSVVRRMRRDRA